MPGNTKVQIYLGAATVQEVIACAHAGVDFIGMVADEQLILSPEFGGVLPSVAEVAAIFGATPLTARKVALTFSTDLRTVVQTVRAVKSDVVHLAGLPMFTPAQLEELRVALPRTKLMQAIAVNRPDPLAAALARQDVCDYFLLDTQADSQQQTKVVGATGVTHDWSVSARIVREVSIPVMLAGGLGPDNVADAVRAVAPWGVDSFTRTNRTPDPRSTKDSEKVRQFVTRAKALHYQ